jgi:hypothetical protein
MLLFLFYIIRMAKWTIGCIFFCNDDYIFYLKTFSQCSKRAQQFYTRQYKSYLNFINSIEVIFSCTVTFESY